MKRIESRRKRLEDPDQGAIIEGALGESLGRVREANPLRRGLDDERHRIGAKARIWSERDLATIFN